MDTFSLLKSAFEDARRALDAFAADRDQLTRVARLVEMVAGAVTATPARKVMICGNGGSLCDAAHFAEEMTGRFRNDRRPLAAIACTEPGHLTCTANDYGFDHVFSRWVTALGQRGDVLIVLSTSGNSANCVLAAKAGRDAGMAVVGLMGKDGGKLCGEKLCDLEIVVPGGTSDRIQELHMLILHAVVEGVEARL